MTDVTENSIEWVTGDDTIVVTISQRKYVNKIIKLSSSNPNIDIIEYPDNNNGYLYAKLPIKCLKISNPRTLSDEQKEKIAERFRDYRENDSQNETD